MTTFTQIILFSLKTYLPTKGESKQFLDWPGYISLPLSLSIILKFFFVLCNAGQTYFILVIFKLILGSLSPRPMKMSNMT